MDRISTVFRFPGASAFLSSIAKAQTPEQASQAADAQRERFHELHERLQAFAPSN